MAKQQPLTLIQKVNPINKDIEKKKFLFDPLYNPQFEYPEEISEQEFAKYGAVASDRYVPQAKHILDTVIKKYGSESKYIEEVEGPVITREELTTRIHTYLKRVGLEDQVSLRFSTSHIARTSVHKREIFIRLPIDHRDLSLEGVLHHEIGTHLLRNINDELQPWHGKKKQFGFRDHLETEEGLAVLNFYHSASEKYLWLQALYYYAAYLSGRLSFSQLFKELEKYVDDKERRWKICLRMKRGVKDTSLPGGFTKDQVYFAGAVRVMQWLKQNNFDPSPLYVGKVDIENIETAQKIASSEKVLLPFFILEMNYKHQVQLIMQQNNLSF